MKYIITLGIFLILFFNAVSGHAEVIDNSDPGFSSGGSWPSSSYIVGYYGENYQYMAPGNGFNTANWTFDVLAGQYEISAQWTSHSNRASNAGYTVFNNGVEIGTVYVDQRSNGGLFNLLDSYDLEAGVLEVVLTDAADGYVIADAVKITYLGSEINQAPDGVIDAPSGEVTILAGETVVFTGTGTDPDGHSPLTYLWHFGDPAIPDSTSEDPGSVQFNNIGTYTVTFTVTDSQGLADDTPASVMIHVQPESELEIVDNSDPSFSVNGYWPNSNIVPGYYGSDYQYSSPGPGNKEAVWRFSTVTGQYEISAQWTSHSNRASNAAYTVFNNGVEIDTVYVDQRSNGGLFNLLDSYDLEAGTLEVVLTDDADGYVIADAVKITYLDSESNQAPDGVIDAPSGEVTIFAGETVFFTGTGTDPDDHTPLTYLWHFGDPAIPDSTSEDPGSVQFNNIGTYTVTFTVTDSQGLADDTPASVMIHVQPESELEIVDNSDPSFSVNGYWPNSNIVPGYYGSDYQYSSPGPGNKEAVWRFSTVTGQYEISAQWTSHSNRASNAGYTVFNNGVEIDTVYVDQLSNGGQFNLLDSYDLEAGTLEVVLTDDADGYVIADAVKITYLDSEINQAPDGVIDAPSGEVTIIAGETVVFTGTGTDPDSNYPLTYLWNFGLGSGVPESSNEDPGEIQFNNEGVFIVTFTVADFIGRVDSTPATLKVNVVAESTYEKDVCVYGGTAGGVIAAIAAADMGSSVILVEPGTHLGGMTSGGLGATDTGKTNSITGLTRDFYERLGARYGKDVSWTHEPHVAEEVLNEMIGEKKVTILFGRRIRSLNKSAGVWIEEVVFENSTNPSQPTVTVSADAFIDCTYEGDLMAKAGVSYIVGRESNVQYGETYNGVRRYWTMPSGVDPYVIPGDPASGLLPFSGVNTSLIGANGSADGLTQAYCFRLCMTTRANRRAISKPAGYDPGDFEFFLRALNRKNPANLSKVFLIRELPNGKWDWNNQEIAGVSLDLVGASHAYPEAGYQTRSQIRQAHLDYTTGLLYFLGHDAQVPQHIRNEMLLWGLCQDEFQDSGGWPHQLYVREARRMIGRYVMTEANCALSVTVDDGIAQGSYAVDSHGVQRYVDDNGWARNEGGFYQYPAGQMAPYDIPYRAITPKANECQNLIVASCISASHVAYSSVRMEPVFMMMGEAAGRAAAMAAEAGIAVQEIDVAQLQTYLATG